MQLRLFDLDGSLDAQHSLRDVAAWSAVTQVALRDLAPGLRLWSRAATIDAARARLASAPVSSDAAITLIGSGDYHHLAVLLIEQVREPVTVVHFDNHPDWVRWAPRWHCGSWVNQVLRIKQVAKVVTIGPTSEDLTRPQLKGANLSALAAGRIALFPWQHAPSRVWGTFPSGAGHRYENGYLFWRNLHSGSAAENSRLILEQIGTEAVWFSIDKDVLAESEALTNWDQGQMPLAAICELIAAIGAHKRIVGADICGEYSEPEMANLFKRIESRFDRPQRLPDSEALERNETVNRTLLATIARAAAA